jgi:predicted aldo/keto reductase-like oxidoreductase
MARVYGLLDWARQQYAGMEQGKRAGACIRCASCEPKCQNELGVVDRLAEVEEVLGRA